MLWTATQGADNYQEQEYEWLSIGKDVIRKLIRLLQKSSFQNIGDGRKLSGKMNWKLISDSL